LARSASRAALYSDMALGPRVLARHCYRNQFFFSAGIGCCASASALSTPSIVLRRAKAAFGLHRRCAVVIGVRHG
jgi:hypothetical protein